MTMQEIILDIMKKEGVKQNVLADRLKISRQALSQMLHGQDMKISTVSVILTALGYEIRVEKRESDE